jgi:hypothetical protein
MKTLKFIISSNAEFIIAQGTREEMENEVNHSSPEELKKRLLDHKLALSSNGQGNLWLDDTKPIADQVQVAMTKFLEECQITMEMDKKTNMIDSLLHDLNLLLSCKEKDCSLRVVYLGVFDN